MPDAGTSTTYILTLTAHNGAVPDFTQTFTLTVDDAPQITSANNTLFGVGNYNDFNVATSGLPYPTFTITGALPQGVSLDDNFDGSADLSGTPAAGTAGTYNFTITASNGIGTPATQNFTLMVGGFSSTTATFTVGQNGTFNLTTTDFPAGISLSVSPNDVPSGLTFTDNGNGTATLSGIPMPNTSKEYTVPVNVMQGSTTIYTQDLDVTVEDVPTITSSSGAFFTANTSDTFQVDTYGLPDPALTETGTLPGGVTFTDNGDGTATISGTPSSSADGSYPITIRAQNSLGSNPQSFTLVVGTAPAITSAVATDFSVGQNNSFTITTTGTPTSALTESGDDLPTGVTFTDNGNGTATLSGMPAAGTEGTYYLTIQASNGPGSYAYQSFTLLVGTGAAFTCDQSTTFVLGQNNTFSVTTVGTPTASLTESGALPSGVGFTDNGNGTGTLSGMPAAGSSSSYSFSITADDGVDPPVTQYFNLYVYAPTQFTSSASTGFIVGQYNDFSVTTSYDPNLYGGPTLTETGNLPSGVTFDPNSGGTADIDGYPDTGTDGMYNFTITATTGNGVPDVSQNFTLVVGTSAPTITSAASTILTVGTAGSFTVTTTGSPTASISETGTLPTGVTFTDNGDGTATLGGMPTGSAGTYKLTLDAHNGLGTDAMQTFTLTLATAPAITSNNSDTFTVGQSGTFSVTSTGSPTASLTETGALPFGVTFTDNGNGTATLAGKPLTDTGGSYPITITAHNGGTPDAVQSFTLDVNDAPQITSSASAIFSAGSSNTVTITTYGFPAPALTETGTLPSGVTFKDNGDGTATLAGMPSLGVIGSYSFTINAQNSQGSAPSQSFLLLVGEAPAFTSDQTTTFGVGQAATFTITTTGAPIASLTESGTLPSGVTYTNNGDGTATLSGTPAAGTAGLYELTLTAQNAVGSGASESFYLLVGTAPAFTSAASATFGVGGPGAFTITTTGSPAAALSESGNLPSGLDFTDNGDGTASISGTPDSGTAGTYRLTLTASNGAGNDATQSFTLTVSGTAPAITSAGSDTFTVGQSGSFSVITTGSPTAALTESGALPQGVTFTDKGNGTATLTGMPAAGTAGTYDLVITAAPSTTSSSASQDFVLTIDDAPQITSANSTAFAVGVSDSFTVTTYGFPTPTLTESGNLPTGVSFTDNGNGTATLAGMPAAGSGGTYNVTITAGSATQSFTLTVGEAQAPAITSGSSLALTVGQAGTFTVTTTGLPTAALTEAGGLPQGITFTDNGDGTATISGTPAAGTAGAYNLVVTASNGTSPDAVQDFLLTVKDAPQITSPASATFSVSGGLLTGGGGGFTITTYGFPAPTLTESGTLPTGFTFTDNGNGTATLGGSPAAGTYGTYNLTFTASNGVGSSSMQQFTLTVVPPPGNLVFDLSPAQTSFTVGQFGTCNVFTSDYNGPPYKLTETGVLPANVTFKDNGDGTATISGTPAAGTGGKYLITITASGGTGDNYTLSFLLYVNSAPSFTSPANTVVYAGQSASFAIKTQGTPQATVTESGTLPTGVFFNDSSFDGTPAPDSTGTYNIVLTATNTLGSVTQNFTLTVEPVPAFVFTFTEGQSSSDTVTNNVSGKPALTESGALPAGVTFTDNGDGTGSFSGTPLVGSHGTYPVAVTATAGSSSQTLSYILDVNSPPQITSKASKFFMLGQDGFFSITTTGFPSPTLTESGALPQGVTFNPFGYLAGEPDAGSAGVYNITLTASNGTGSAATQDYTLVVGPTPSVTYANIPDFAVGQVGSFTFTTNGNNPPLTLTESGTLPAGVVFGDNGDGTATLSGAPAPGTGGSYYITVTASNGFTNAQQYFQLSVDEAPAITSGNTATFVAGSVSSFSVTTTGYPGASFTEEGALPSGVSFTPIVGTDTLGGTPAPGTEGMYNIAIVAQNGIGDDVTQNFTLTVISSALTFTSGDTGTLTAGQHSSLSIAASGSATPSLTESGTLPSGVTFMDNGNGTATLGGNPAANAGGTYTLLVTAHDGVDPDVVQSFTLTVSAAAAFTSSASGGLIVGQSYNNIQITTTGFPYPSITESGTLPSGVTFTDNGYGSFTGTLAAGATGTYNIVLTAHNGIGIDATQHFTLVVASTPAITSGKSTTFTAGQMSSFTITTTGSPAATVSELETLPAGITLTNNGDGTATLGGIPAAGTGGTYPLYFLAQNAFASSSYQSFTLTINESPPTITSNASNIFLAGQYNSFDVTTTGFPVPTVTESGTLPSGVTFSSGTFSGTPASGTSGSYPITITANAGAAGQAMQSFTLIVQQPAAFSSTPTYTFNVGQSGSFTINGTGSPTSLLTNSGNLPAGISYKDNGDGTATLSGTPAAGTGGVYLLSLSTHNGLALDGTQNLFVFVDQAPGITSSNADSFALGQENSFTVTTTGFPAPMLTESGTLPSGVTFQDNGDGTATLSGMPATGSGGSYAFTITASNGPSSNATQSFTLTVASLAITSADSTSFIVGQMDSFTVTTTGSTTPSLNESGSLPTGVSFKDNGDGTATITGMAGAGTAGSYTLTLTAHNGVDPDATQTFTLNVNQVAQITSAAATTFTVGSSGTFSVTTNGVPMPTLSETGSLPSGVTFTDNGNGTATIAGKPLAGTGGAYTLNLTAHNGVGSDATQSFALTVDEAPAITSANNDTLLAGVSGTFTIKTAGYPLPSIMETGTLPAGMTFKDNGDGTATLTGIPTAGGVFPISFTAQNAPGNTAMQSFTLTVNQAPAITSASTATFASGQNDSFTVRTIGTPTPSLTESGPLPTGVTFTDNGNGTATLTGMPAVNAAGTYNISFTAHNGIGSDFMQSFTLTVVAVANHLVVQVPAQAVARGQFAVTVLAETPDNQVDPHYNGSVTLALNAPPTGVTLAGTLTAVVVDGVATFNNVSVSTAGSYTLVAASSTDLIAGSTTVNVVAAPQFKVSLAPATSGQTGSGQTFTATISALLGRTPDTAYAGTVDLTSSDPQAMPVTGTFQAGGGGTLQLSLVLKTAGKQTATVADTSLPTDKATSNAVTVGGLPLVLDHFLVSGIPASDVVGVPHTVTIKAVNAANQTDTSFTGTVTLTSSDGSINTPVNFVAKNKGVQTATVNFTATGTETLTATGGGEMGKETGIVVVSPATHLGITALPATVTAGNQVTLTVTALTAANKTDALFADTLLVTTNDPLAQVGTPTIASGVATYTITFYTAGTRTITVTDRTRPTIKGPSKSVTVSAAAPTQLVVTSAPLFAVANKPVAITVTAEDAFGNTVPTGFLDKVTLSTGQSATFLKSDKGKHVFMVTFSTAGMVALTASDSTHSSVATSSAVHIDVVSSAVAVSPTDPTGGSGEALIVVIPAGGGTVQLMATSGSDTTIQVTEIIAGKKTTFGPFPLTTADHIIVYGQTGNDVVQELAGAGGLQIAVPAIVLGGSGNNTLSAAGSSAGNVLVGGPGKDSLTGGSGADVLIGGGGADTLKAGSGGDVLIGGSATIDNNLMALAAVLAEWDSGDPYATRVQDLFGTDTGGLNGSAFLDHSTVINDAAINQLFGGSGQDWFWLEGTDKVSGVKAGRDCQRTVEVCSARSAGP